MPTETTTSPRRRSSPPATKAKPFAPPALPPLAPIEQPIPALQTNGQSIPQSPVAPAFSPITPRAVPALPAISIPPQPPPQNGSDTTAFPAATNTTTQPQQPGQQQQPPKPAIAPSEFIPPPPPQPFSSEDSTDAIALRAAISSLQFQKKKAQDDIRTLEKVRKQALDDPARFKEELAAGRVQEKKMTAGDLRAILDADSGEDDDDDDDDNDEENAIMKDGPAAATASAKEADSKPQPFSTIPGSQNVVRMPHINWDKYRISGEALDRLHEQQRKWPGNLAYGTDRGREYTVAAPYSPWLDPLEGGNGQERKDSGGGSFSPATGTVSEHPMETRRGGVKK